jgi:hypothetical protein
MSFHFFIPIEGGVFVLFRRNSRIVVGVTCIVTSNYSDCAATGCLFRDLSVLDPLFICLLSGSAAVRII